VRHDDAPAVSLAEVPHTLRALPIPPPNGAGLHEPVVVPGAGIIHALESVRQVPVWETGDASLFRACKAERLD
jgi:hypothetical protein